MEDNGDKDERDAVSEDGTYEADHHWDRETKPSDVVLEAVANLRGEDPIDLPPMHDAIDPDAIDRILAGPQSSADASLELTFQFGGCDVRLCQDGHVEITRSE